MRCRLLALLTTLCVVVAGVSAAPAVAADPTIVIGGTVFDEARDGLAGVSVFTRLGAESFEPVTTDADGHYAVTVPLRTSRSFRLTFAKDGWISREREPYAWAGVDIPGVNTQLERYATVTGSIAAPVADVPDLRVRFDAQTAGKDEAVPADPSGRFAIDSLVPGRYYVTFEDADDRTRWFQRSGEYMITVASGETIDLGSEVPADESSPPTGSIVLESASVQRDYPKLSAWLLDGPTDYTLFRGPIIYRDVPETVLSGLVPGRYKVSLDGRGTWFGGLSEASATTVTVEPGQATRVRADVGPESYVTGQIVNTAREPITGLNVEVLRRDSPGEVVGEDVTSGGEFAIGDLPVADYYVRVSDATGEYLTQELDIRRNPHYDDEHVIQRSTPVPAAYPGPASASASGTILTDRQPGMVCFVPSTGRVGTEIRCGDVEDGRYAVDGIKPGDYRLRVGVGNHGVEQVVWKGGASFASASTVTFAADEQKVVDAPGLADHGYLSGWVTDRNGRKIPRITVLAYAADNPDEILGRTVSQSMDQVLTADGFWTLAEMPARPYKLRFVDGAGHFASTWLGGSSFETARTITPRLWATTVIPDAIMHRRLEALAPPTISGTTQVGSTLTATRGSWSVEGLSYSYRWMRDGSPVPGAEGEGPSYRLTAADVGRHVSVRVAGRDSSGTHDSTTSLATAPITDVPPVAGPAPRVRPSVTTTVKRLGGGTVRLTVRYSGRGVTPTGRVSVRRGSKTVASWRQLRNGRFSVTLRHQPKGRVRYTVRYSGSGTFLPVTRQTARVRVR